jgi:hypothetical protein
MIHHYWEKRNMPFINAFVAICENIIEFGIKQLNGSGL